MMAKPVLNRMDENSSPSKNHGQNCLYQGGIEVSDMTHLSPNVAQEPRFAGLANLLILLRLQRKRNRVAGLA